MRRATLFLRRTFVVFTCLCVLSTTGFAGTQPFIRGDSNSDGNVDISDGVFTLGVLFGGEGPPTCEDALDANDSGEVDISDAVWKFNFLFLGGETIAAPFPGCGVDPTDDGLSCDTYSFCEPLLDTVTQLTEVRATEDGAADILVPGLVVTYLRPLVGNDPAGFFVQASEIGPAILIEIDPSSTDPALSVGDVIDVRVTEVNTITGLRCVTGIADLTIVDSNFDVSTYVQTVGDVADLPALIDDYESELVSTSCELVGAFRFAGLEHTASAINTPAVVDSPDLRLRMPAALRDLLANEHNFIAGCELEITGPMWRFFDEAQPSVYYATDVDVVSCPEPPSDPSDVIAAARVSGDGAADFLLRGAVVTYVRPAVGSAPAAFFVQARQEGPAIAVEVDPESLDPGPVPGDVVTFRITELDTVFTARTVTGLSEWLVADSGFDLGSLTQDVSLATDLVSALDDYESELLHVVCSLAGAFNSAGGGHVASIIETDGVAGDSNLRLRIPTTVRDELAASSNLVETCQLEFIGPMWRFNSQAQPSAYAASEITVSNCPAPPAPQVTGAAASSTTDVVVSFSLEIDPASVDDAGNQFLFTPAVEIVDSAVDGTDVTLTTTGLSSSTEYEVVVAESVTTALGAGVDPFNNSAVFNSLASGLSISGVDYEVIAHGADLSITGNQLLDIDEVTIGGEPQSYNVDSATQITVTGVLDSTPVGAQDLVISTTDSATDPFALTVIHLVINEVDADQTSTDSAEFVEISAGAAGVDLSGYTVVLFNGNGDSAYNRVELAGTTNDDGLIWIGPAGFSPDPQLTFTAATNAVQNGADGVVLAQGAAADFPGGSGIPEAGIIDAIAYDTSDGDDAGLLDGIYGADNPLAIQINENENGMKDTQSIQRCGDARLDGNVWTVIEPTAGAGNNCP